ncbi:DnaB-like helicase N-terminal domain-containing protein, partial [Kitasatospora purpeofusca]|uniref:DnaB-like helicase N-terminal domain-containing protein n=1 Tax=Kitasatospora purpeofusca TaxID=67352 RepID=UPI0035D5F30F
MTGPQYDDHDAPPPPEDDWQGADDPFPVGAFADAPFPDGPGDRLPVSRARGNGQGKGEGGGFQKGGKGGSGGSGGSGGFQRDGKRRQGGDDERSGEGGLEGFERVPPQDLAAEQSVLGGMLLSKDAIADVVEVLKPA